MVLVQIMYPESRPGEFYLVDTECVNGGIPYSDNFYIVNRYCLTRVSPAKTRLMITSQIKYRKNIWGFVRNFLDRNVTAGIVDAFSSLGQFVLLPDVVISCHSDCSLIVIIIAVMMMITVIGKDVGKGPVVLCSLSMVLIFLH